MTMNRISAHISTHISTRISNRTRSLIATGLVLAAASGSAFAIGGHNAPCDGMADCIFTAWWYAFLR